MTAAAQPPGGEIRGDNTNEYKGRKKRSRSTGGFVWSLDIC